MRLKIRVAGVASAVMLGASALTFAGAPASAAPGNCYPPSQCHVGFSHSSYKRGHHVHFSTGKAFGRHESVKGVLTCRHHYHHHTRNFTAGLHGRLNASFYLPKKTPKGTCTFLLVGLHNHHSISNHFQVTG